MSDSERDYANSIYDDMARFAQSQNKIKSRDELLAELQRDIWNAAIEAAAENIKSQYDHYGDPVIRHYKPMWIEEIRKLKK